MSLLVLCTIVVSCGASPGTAPEEVQVLDGGDVAESSVGWGSLAVVDGYESGDEALTGGTLRLGEDCVLLDDGTRLSLLVWPGEQTRWDDETSTIRYTTLDGETVSLGDGDQVWFGGGEGLSGQPADEFLSSVNWVARPAGDCVMSDRWFIGGISDLVPSVAAGATATTPSTAVQMPTVLTSLPREGEADTYPAPDLRALPAREVLEWAEASRLTQVNIFESESEISIESEFNGQRLVLVVQNDVVTYAEIG